MSYKSALVHGFARFYCSIDSQQPLCNDIFIVRFKQRAQNSTRDQVNINYIKISLIKSIVEINNEQAVNKQRETE